MFLNHAVYLIYRDVDAFEKSARLVLELYGGNVSDVNFLKSVQSNV